MTSRRYISFFKRINIGLLKKAMAGDSIQTLESKALEAEHLAAELRSELSKLQAVVGALKLVNNVNSPAYQELVKENTFLKKEIERYKTELTGRKGNASVVNLSLSENAALSNPEVPAQPSKIKPIPEKVSKEKSPAPEKVSKEKPTKEKKPASDKAVEEPPVDVGRLDFRVGKIVEVKKHPDADSLYVEQVDVGEAKPRTVVSGLVKHVTLEEMQNRMVIILCNLKPAKMRGVTSEGMVMCASTPEKVEILSPPAGSVPGDVIEVSGFQRAPDSVLNPKKKIFETVAHELLTNAACVATYRGVAWTVPGKGEVKTNSLAGVNIK